MRAFIGPTEDGIVTKRAESGRDTTSEENVTRQSLLAALGRAFAPFNAEATAGRSRSAGTEVRYLLAFSPELNPIERFP
ncbi:hypothetical protein TA3x_002553 [Tundrisphaera sp. TA3]|uniref:hypothetical protein n=1 Tax=Tundrisphaera sp. TA3 TaxID=3435775 RepID=UPI003EBA89DA